jgi:hypothetical protein
MGMATMAFDNWTSTDTLQRIEELGYDRDERQYYVLDDNRLYRRTEPPIPEPVKAKAKPKATSLKAQAARRRASKRRKVIEDSETPEVMTKDEEEEADNSANDTTAMSEAVEDGPVDTFGGFKWELIAITKTQYEEFVDTLGKREPNEKILRQRILEEVMPIIEQAEEKQRRKIERRERDLLTMEKMATAKRSSRLQDKHDKERQDAERAEAELKRSADLAAAHREQERQEKMEKDRQSRMLTREQRIKDREYKRLLEEEQLLQLAEEERRIAAGELRASERRVRNKLQEKKKNLEELAEDDDWTFDCSGCGVFGKNLDDGEHSIACEKCNVWQHSKCLGISKAAAEKDDFHFVCADCKQKEADAKKPKISLKFRAGVSSSPPSSRDGPATQPAQKPQFAGVHVPKQRPAMSNGYTAPHSSPPAQHRPLTYNQPNSGIYNGNAPPYYQEPRAPQYTGYGSRQPYQRPGSSSGSQNMTPGNMQAGQSPIYNGAGRAQQPSYSPQPLQSPPINSNPRPAIQQKTEEQKAKIAQQRAMLQQRQAEILAQSQRQGSGVSAQQAHPPYYNGTPHTYQAYPPQQRQSPTQSMPRPTSSHSNSNGMSASPSAQRIPSPVLNRPNMQPTQGNYDTASITGMAEKSPTMNYHPALFAPSPSPHPQPQVTPQQQQYQSNGTYRQSSQTPVPVSGLSPTKHSPPLNNTVSPVPHAAQRSVSGTPLFPPAEKLAPSPEQMSKEPVPTPMKMDVDAAAPTPSKRELDMGGQELRRVNEEVKASVEAHIRSEGAV